MVRLLGREVGHRVVAEPRQGVGDADQGQPPLPGGAELPHRRRAPLQRLVRRLHRRQQERHARGREALPTSVRGRLRRLACDPPVHEPERAAGTAVDAAVQTDRRGSFAFARLAGQRVLRAGSEGGRNGRRLRARNPGPRERALPRRHQHPVLVTSVCGTGCSQPARCCCSWRPNRSSRYQARPDARGTPPGTHAGAGAAFAERSLHAGPQ